MTKVDYVSMDAGTMYQVCGDDAQKWADAFVQFHPNCGIGADVMFAWICNFMMAKVDFMHGQPILCGDHAAWLRENLDDEG